MDTDSLTRLCDVSCAISFTVLWLMNCHMKMKYKNRGPSLYVDICTVMALVGEPNM
jgi:hypothetical protein